MSNAVTSLPLRAQRKFSALVDAEVEAQAAVRSTNERIGEMFKASRLGENHRNEIERLQNLLAKHQARFTECANAASTIRRFIDMLPVGTTLEDAPREKPQLRKGETLLQAVTRMRSEIATLRAEQRRVFACVPTATEAKAAGRAYVRNLAKAGRPSIKATHAEFGITFEADTFATGANVKAMAILAWLDPDALIARIDAEIDARPTTDLALTAKQKAERLADVTAKLGALEHMEERAIELAADDGQTITRRYDADPAAVLSVLVKRRKAVAA